MLVASLGQVYRALLFVKLIVFFRQIRDDLVDRDVEIGTVVRWPRNDQRRARLVDKDGIDLINDRIMMAALNHLGELVLHIVAQIVEAELIIGAIGDVGGIGAAAFVVIKAVDDDSGREAKKPVDAANPFGVAAGEVIVDGND